VASALYPFFLAINVRRHTQRNVTAYFERLKVRPSVARVLCEAGPYFNMVPK
jgi:hypothetical protein